MSGGHLKLAQAVCGLTEMEKETFVIPQMNIHISCSLGFLLVEEAWVPLTWIIPIFSDIFMENRDASEREFGLMHPYCSTSYPVSPHYFVL